MELYPARLNRIFILMKIYFTVLLTVLSLCSCDYAFTGKPTYDLPYQVDESAPPLYKLGWQHGCYSGFSAYGNNWYKSQYKFTQDMRYVGEDMYFKPWTDGFNYCRAYVNRTLAGDRKVDYQENPTLFSTTGLTITSGNLRDDPTIYKTGIFGGRSSEGMIGGGPFNAVKLPWMGSAAWGASVDSCDWLNRCGDDKPKDAVDAMLGY